MRRVPNPELDRIILDHLAKKYRLLEKREGIHLSTLNYCLTKGYFDQTCPADPSDTELLNFATGYGLQEVMFPAGETTPLFIKNDIIYRPDGVLPVHTGDVDRLIEIKSTRAGVKRYQSGDLPETWITYMKGGCYIRGTKSYDLGVIYLAERPSALILSETVYFEDNEIEENWQWILGRKKLYSQALASKTVPPPYTTAPEWMCKNCRYSTMCEAITLLKNKGGAPS